MNVLRITIAIVTLGPLSLSSAHANGAEPPGSNAFSRLVSNVRQRHDGTAPIAHTPATPTARIVDAPEARSAPAVSAPSPAPALTKSSLGALLMHQLASHWHSVPVIHADSYVDATPPAASPAPVAPAPTKTIKTTEAPAPAPKIEAAPSKVVEKPAVTLVKKADTSPIQPPMKAFLQSVTDRMLVATNREDVAEDLLGELAGRWTRGTVTAEDTRVAVVLIGRWQSHLDQVVKNVAKQHPTFERTLRSIIADAR